MGWDDHDMILYTILTNWLAEVGVVAKETHGPYQRKLSQPMHSRSSSRDVRERRIVDSLQ